MEIYAESATRHWPFRGKTVESYIVLHSEMSSVARGFLAERGPKPAVDVIPGYYVREREVRDVPKKKETCGQLRFEKSEMKHARPLFNRVVSGRMVNQFETMPRCNINFMRDKEMNSSELANSR